MKTVSFFLFVFLLTPRAFSQDPSAVQDEPRTHEENFYSGDQVNPEAFSQDEDPYLRQEEEEIYPPYNPHDEIYPYENMDAAEEAEYLEEY